MTDGTVYRRPPRVEAQIDEALLLSRPDLMRRVLNTDRSHPAYLGPEVLVHLARKAGRSGDQAHLSEVLQALLTRCSTTLQAKVTDRALADAADVRQKILDDLVDLFLEDATGSNPDELDIYECRFNMAFGTLRIDAVRSAQRRHAREVPLGDLAPPAEAGALEGDEEVLPRISEALSLSPTQEQEVFRIEIIETIDAMPPDVRRAFTLVHVWGLKQDSLDPQETTAAKLCNCTGRTIRNHLKRAAGLLAHFVSEEDL
jgi:hypothetical protein